MPLITNDAPKRAATQTIGRAGLILACFTPAEPFLTLAELAGKVDLNPSTVYRYLTTLEAVGLLVKEPNSGRYGLGLKVIELAGTALSQNEACSQSLDTMDRLRDELGYPVSLRVLLEGDVLDLGHAVPKDAPRIFPVIGRRWPAHLTAAGKALLADLPAEGARALIDRYGWRPTTPQSIQDHTRLEAELAETRERGYSTEMEEFRRGLGSLAAPIYGSGGAVVAALSLTAGADQLTPEYRRRLLPPLLAATERISFRLGFRGACL